MSGSNERAERRRQELRSHYGQERRFKFAALGNRGTQVHPYTPKKVKGGGKWKESE